MDNIYNKDVENSFKDYLTTSKNNPFVLDLSDSTLIGCVEEMCKIKSSSHPKIMHNYDILLKKLKMLETVFGCTIYPSMISSVFWNHFIPFLANQGLKYSTIGLIKSSLISVLNWSSKYGVKLNPSYNEIDVPNYISGKISLTPDEISHIYHFILGAKKFYSFRLKKEVMYRKNKIKT